MKRFLARACAKIGRFFWSWGFLKFVLAIIALIVFFYVEENWRGAHAWAVTKAKWEAKGESFDYKKFIPPPIPDDQNLAALPLFQMEPATHSDEPFYARPVALEKAMRKSSDYVLPLTGNWQRGELPDRKTIQDAIAAEYAAVFKGIKPPQDTLAQFDALYAPITALSCESSRPVFLLKAHYEISPPFSRPLGAIADGIGLSRILTLHAVLAFQDQRSDLALGDIETNYKILEGIKRDPTLVGGLVAIGIAAITDDAIYGGLAQHDWSDAQLVELEHTLEPIDWLADSQFAMRSEAAETAANIDYFKRQPRSKQFHMIAVPFPWLDGWLDQNKRQFIDFHLDQLSTVDPHSHRAFPKISLELANNILRDSDKWKSKLPWNFWFSMAAKGEVHLVQKYVEAQVWLDEVRIACALERFHLAHGTYPSSLEALVPTYMDAVPHDIINGNPYRYQLRPDGTFLLYSVGWNEKDDGGVAVYSDPNNNGHPTQDYDRGDWVWPTPK